LKDGPHRGGLRSPMLDETACEAILNLRIPHWTG
jgi:hypothetical protein